MTEPDPLPSTGVYRMYEGFLLKPNRDDPGSTFSRIAFQLPNMNALPDTAARETTAAPETTAEPDAAAALVATAEPDATAAPDASAAPDTAEPGTTAAAASGERGADLPAVRIAVAEKLPFSPFREVVSSAVVDHASTGCHDVWFVRDVAGQVFLDRVTLDRSAETASGPGLSRTTYPLGNTWVRSVTGEVVLASGTRTLLVAGTSSEGVVVGSFDATAGKLTNTWTLTGSPAGSLVGSWIVVRDLDPWLFATVRAGAALLTVAVEVKSLAAGKPLPPADVHLLPKVDVAATSGVASTLGRLLTASAAQQLILAANNPGGNGVVVVQGFDAGKPAQIALAPIDTAFAKPRTSDYRVTCADLDNNGQEELVVAYAADYVVSGAAAFVLFRFDEKQRKLEPTSRYVAAGPGGAPLATMDLRLGSGILGDAVTSGVFVLGAGGDFAHIKKGEVQIFAGIVPVNPVTLRFPPYAEVPATLPAVTQVADTGLTAPGILGSVADLFGLSVTLGQPTFTQLSSRGQLLAILQVPPFDIDAMRDRPLLTFSESDTKVKGLSVTSSKDWMMSVDAGLSLGIDTSSLSFHTGNSYGRGFSKMAESSTTTGVQISRMPTQLDRLVTISFGYSVWRYPIIRRSRGQESGGMMMVIFPASAIAVQSTPIAYDAQFGYRSRYEPGSLLTYMNVDLDGWDESKQRELLLFTPLVSLEVTSDPPDTNTYDRTDTNQDTVGKTYFVAGTTSTSANLLASTTLFSYLPVSFGFNLSTSESYSDSEMEMTSLSRTEALSISVTGGSVTDSSLRYRVTPYIYQHAGLGATVVAFKVDNLGPGWRTRFASPWPMLILPFRTLSEHPLERIFSRSIGFEKQTDGSVQIVVEVFNQSFTDAEIVNARLYRGQPSFDDDGRPVIPPDADRIGEVSGRVVALGRQRLRVRWTPEREPSFVTAVVWGGNRVIEIAEVAWNVYPESAFTSLGLPGVEDA